MKKLLLFLFLIPNLVMAETWNCSYKSTEGPAVGKSSFTRDGNLFISTDKFSEFKESKDEYLITKENEYSIILVFQGTSDFVVELKKERKIEGKINYIDLRDMAQWKGNCLVTW